MEDSAEEKRKWLRNEEEKFNRELDLKRAEFDDILKHTLTRLHDLAGAHSHCEQLMQEIISREAALIERYLIKLFPNLYNENSCGVPSAYAQLDRCSADGNELDL